MNSLQFQKFGKYTLLDRIAVGGMAEVFRGKITGQQGFEKLVVIKKMLPHLASDQNMVAHFIDEAKLAALFQHENIVHIYDFGETKGDYFLAMEYLHGKDLKSVFRKLSRFMRKWPPVHIFHITASICEGLDYAHNLKDLYGVPLNFVHRDVSPQNIYVTYDGKIKLLDFGISKTVIQEDRTQAGTIKGKVAFMSPEQAQSRPLDRRSDVFCVGILLYEMLTGQRMFVGEPHRILSRVAQADFIAPEKIAPGWPDAIYRILHKALAKLPEDRYPSCRHLRIDIEQLCHSEGLRPSAEDLSQFMQDLFCEEHVAEQRSIQELLKRSRTMGEGETEPADKSDTHAESVLLGVDDAQSARGPGDEGEPADRMARQKKLDQPVEPRLDARFNVLKKAMQRSTPLVPAWPRFIKISAMLVVLAVIGLLFWWKPLHNKKHPSLPSPAVTPYAAPAAESHRPSLVSNGKVEGNPVSLKTSEINALLTNAAKRLNEYQLTTPPDDSALHYFNEVLKLDPENRKALSGYTKIADRYALLAQKEMDEFRYRRAAHFIRTGLAIKPDHPRLLALRRESRRSLPGKVFKSIGNNFKKLAP